MSNAKDRLKHHVSGAIARGEKDAIVERIKVSTWLSSLDSHTVYEYHGLAGDFQVKTGELASWPTTSLKDTRERMRNDPRGGQLYKDDQSDETRVVYGYSLAVYLASQYVRGFKSTKMGRGFMFHEAIDALIQAGK